MFELERFPQTFLAIRMRFTQLTGVPMAKGLAVVERIKL
jgi:hypothetical protein